MYYNRYKKALVTVSFFAIISSSFGQIVPVMRYEDKIRIREAMIISSRVGDKIWNGFNKAPFVVLLVTDSIEFLINHPYPSGDFKYSENDTILKTVILYRVRQYSDRFLATFPAVNGVNCIVVGTPEKTSKNSTNWIVTLLHEHFHQFQFTSNDYYSSVDKLNLSGGDQTGMWQLNYPFPYENKNIISLYKSYTNALSTAVANINSINFNKLYKKYLNKRIRFKKNLSSSDYRYFSFQIWQEGIARYTEHKILETMHNYEPSKEVVNLKDFEPFHKVSEEFYISSLRSIAALQLNIDKRVCFYGIGFGEGLLLDKLNPKWRDKYLSERFYIENYYKN